MSDIKLLLVICYYIILLYVIYYVYKLFMPDSLWSIVSTVLCRLT